MTQQRVSVEERSIVGRLLTVVLSAIPFGLAAGYATGDYLASFVTGLAMAGVIQVFTELDLAFFHPRLKGLPLNWREAVELTFGLFYYILGAGLALFVCHRIFDFVIEGVAARAFVGLAFAGFLVAHLAFYFLHFHRALKEKVIEEERLRVLTAQAELKALKAQINPHFLFNTLNTIAQLTHTDPTLAEAIIERLAEMLRYVLASTEEGMVPLEEELSFVDSYLEIERARFGKRLCVTCEIDPQALDVPVPSLILQPLVENALKHGREEDGSVDLAIRVAFQDEEVLISIADQGPGILQEDGRNAGPGVGSRNVDERLRKTYGYGLEVLVNEPRGTVVIVRIPV